MERDRCKKHKTAYTSVLSWRECIKEGLLTKEKLLVLNYLFQEKEAQTSRQISHDLQIERTNITRTLYDLERLDLIEVKYLNKCLDTRRLVKFYGIKQSKEGCK